ncbi:MAG: hypothetical protein ACK4IY_06050 [Chitinophagales bacterium]
MTFPNLPDGFSQPYKRSLWNIFKVIRQSDLVYVRVHTEGFTKCIPFIARLFGKNVIVEINGLPDELKLNKQYSERKIQQIDRSLRRWLRFANAVIAVSPMLHDYCVRYLKCRNVFVIQNGGERFVWSNLQVEDDFKTAVDDICKIHKKIAVWSGTSNPWQGMDMIQKMAALHRSEVGIILISNDVTVRQMFEACDHVYVFDGLNRDAIAYILLHADVGLALYGPHSWSRYNDYYGSSLKYFEYRANGLCVVATPSGHLANVQSEDVFVSGNVADMCDWIERVANRRAANNPYRSWSDVARETEQVIKQFMQ